MFVCGVKPGVDSSDESDEDVMDILMVFDIWFTENYIVKTVKREDLSILLT